MLFVSSIEDLNSVDFSPDCTQLVTSSDDHTARLWDVEHGDCLEVQQDQLFFFSRVSKVFCFCFSFRRFFFVFVFL